MYEESHQFVNKRKILLDSSLPPPLQIFHSSVTQLSWRICNALMPTTILGSFQSLVIFYLFIFFFWFFLIIFLVMKNIYKYFGEEEGGEVKREGRGEWGLFICLFLIM